MSRAARFLAAVLTATALGCGSDEAPQPASTVDAAQPAATPARTPPPLDESCRKPRPTSRSTPRDFMTLDGVVVERITRNQGSPTLEGFIRASPTEFLELVEKSGYRVLFKENERFEADAVVDDGRRRNFWKVTSVCPDGSDFTAIVFPRE